MCSYVAQQPKGINIDGPVKTLMILTYGKLAVFLGRTLRKLAAEIGGAVDKERPRRLFLLLKGNASLRDRRDGRSRTFPSFGPALQIGFRVVRTLKSVSGWQPSAQAVGARFFLGG